MVLTQLLQLLPSEIERYLGTPELRPAAECPCPPRPVMARKLRLWFGNITVQTKIVLTQLEPLVPSGNVLYRVFYRRTRAVWPEAKRSLLILSVTACNPLLIFGELTCREKIVLTPLELLLPPKIVVHCGTREFYPWSEYSCLQLSATARKPAAPIWGTHIWKKYVLTQL